MVQYEMAQRITQWFQNHGCSNLPKPLKGLARSRKTINFMKGTTPKLPEWKMYGRMNNLEQIKPLVDKVFDAARKEFKRRAEDEGEEGESIKKPHRVNFWTNVAMQEYAKVSDDMKIKVRDAVEQEHAINRRSKDGKRLEDNNAKLAELETSVVLNLITVIVYTTHSQIS